ncbi:MAG: aminotransferase class I/II-fold pyridoxal phosphate-dependent enzyme [Lachnospiraceae bacterium]|nr:aminotransferase class I/II-fold pyridoxal phosphate-dependent enzyme [Lachnospiraceae bacterium]
MSAINNYKEDTQLLYQGTEISGIVQDPEVPPIYHTTAYIIKDMDDYDFANGGGKYFYNRTANPNRDSLGTAISYLEKGEETIVCSSGMGAISTALLSLLKCGDHVLFSKAIYGETIELADFMLKDFGIEYDYVDFTDIKHVENGIKANTKILYSEIIANPLTLVADVDEICKIAHRKGALVVIDSTFTTPFVIKPLQHGADIVIHSLTKYFGGHSDITGGSITASSSIIKKIRPKFLLLGCCMDPNTAWLTLRSIKTMGMRVRTQMDNAEKLAKALCKNPVVKTVHHPSIESHPQHELAKKIFDYGWGAMISFRVEDNREKVNEFMHRLQLVKYMGTLGGIRTTIAHPATAFRNEFKQEELEKMGMYEGLIRISTGAEDIEDLIADFNQALEIFK